MIDMHCHILPNVDDGSKSLEESLEMAKIAYKEGIRHIINTSHYHTEVDYVTGERLLEIAADFNAELEKIGIGLRVTVGNELYFNEGLMKSLDDKGFYTLAGSRYVLLEFRPDSIPDCMEEVAYEFNIRGYTPVIAHVERYSQVLHDIRLAENMIDAGFLLQMNSSSLMHKDNSIFARFCKAAMKRRMIHFVASDAHDSKNRVPAMRVAYEEVKRLAGEHVAMEVFISNPQKIMKDEEVAPFEIEREEKWNLFSKLFKKK